MHVCVCIKTTKLTEKKYNINDILLCIPQYRGIY